MNRRGFLGFSLAAVGGIFVPKYAGWFRQGSGIVVPEWPVGLIDVSPLAPSIHGLSGSTYQLWLELPQTIHWRFVVSSDT